MEQIQTREAPHESEYQKEEILLTIDELNYNFTIELSNNKIKIVVVMNSLSPFKWTHEYSLEQLYKVHGLFLQYERLEVAFEVLKNLLKQKFFSLKFQERKMIIRVNFDQIFQYQFDLQLPQTEVDTAEAFVQVGQAIKVLNSTLNSKDEKIDELQQQVNLLKQQLNELTEVPKKFSKILFEKEVQMIGNWINKDKQITLLPVYRATTDGFDINKLFEKCANKAPVILVVQTTLNRRFGFYSDQQIKNYTNYFAQNPNNCFLFSLDLEKKFISNEQNCQHALYATTDRFSLGAGHDFCLMTNSNTSHSSYNGFSSYGKNDGGGYAFLSGTYNFTNVEIEAFQVQQN